MNADQLFSFANSTALLSWIVLGSFPRAKWPARLVTGVIVPLLLAALYAAVLSLHWGETPGNFGSLSGVASLFSNRWLLLAGWIHYLAFDLFIGNWEIRDSRQLGIPYWFVLPCLALTFLFGPVGLLLYFGVRVGRTRSLALES